jgi:hypothetical protein
MEQVPKKGKALTSANFMAVRNSALRLKRPVENITPDVKHCRFLLLAREIVVEDIMRAIWPVIKGEAHRLGFRYASHV